MLDGSIPSFRTDGNGDFKQSFNEGTWQVQERHDEAQAAKIEAIQQQRQVTLTSAWLPCRCTVSSPFPDGPLLREMISTVPAVEIGLEGRR